jgi:AcrR family transcriptional regulator
MPRHVDPTRRAATLAKTAAYVLEHGLAGLSLRPLAKALGTSPRMLLYDFGSKERLIHEILAEIRRHETSLLEADVQSLDDVWEWIAAPEREPFLRLFFETYVAALGRDEAQPLVRDWLAYLQERWTPPVDAATATLMIAVVRGLLLDQLATGDRTRTDAAFRRFTELLRDSPR